MIEVLCAADAGYAAWVGVMLASLLRFDHRVRLHLLADGIGAAALDRIAKVGAEVVVHDVAALLDAHAAELPLAQHLSRAAYARIFFADILPAAVSRVIYLDPDILCRFPLAELWAFDLDGAVAAAARDCAIGEDEWGDLAACARMARDRHAHRLGLPEDGGYFNTGVMLIDVARWREERIGPRTAAWIRANPGLVQLADQDALNCVLRGRVARLPDGWNWLAAWAWREPGADIRIVHFAGPDKPWHADYAGHAAAEWRRVKAASPFRGLRLLRRDGSAMPAVRRLAAHLRRGDTRVRRRLFPTPSAKIETQDAIELFCNDPDRAEVYVNGPYLKLPPGAYDAEFLLWLLQDLPGEGADQRKFVRFEISLLGSHKSIARLEIDVPPGAVLRRMPVSLSFVLPGPVHDLECYVYASADVRSEVRSVVQITRRMTAWSHKKAKKGLLF